MAPSSKPPRLQDAMCTCATAVDWDTDGALLAAGSLPPAELLSGPRQPPPPATRCGRFWLGLRKRSEELLGPPQGPFYYGAITGAFGLCLFVLLLGVRWVMLTAGYRRTPQLRATGGERPPFTLGMPVLGDAHGPRPPFVSARDSGATQPALELSQEPRLENCLCLFDVDRTLTGRQGSPTECPNNVVIAGVEDVAFGLQSQGALALSALGQAISSTFCHHCYRGVVTAGDVGGPGSAERAALLQALGGSAATLGGRWTEAGQPIASPLVVGAADSRKQEWVRNVVEWARGRGLAVTDDRVFFFDDRDGNVPPFAGSGFNARQVSCWSRDGAMGLCGARPEEVTEDLGVASCSGNYS